MQPDVIAGENARGGVVVGVGEGANAERRKVYEWWIAGVLLRWMREFGVGVNFASTSRRRVGLTVSRLSIQKDFRHR